MFCMSTALLRCVRFAVPLLVAIGCVSQNREARSLYEEAARTDPRGHPYVIGISDVVRVTVWKDPNLSADAAVRPDGTITLPLVGQVPAAGSTEAEVQRKIADR